MTLLSALVSILAFPICRDITDTAKNVTIDFFQSYIKVVNQQQIACLFYLKNLPSSLFSYAYGGDAILIHQLPQSFT